MRRSHFEIAIACLTLLCCLDAHATVIVQYSESNNYSTGGTVSYNGFDTQTSAVAQLGGSAADDIVVGRAFSTTVQMNPQTGYNTTLPSAIFYGGYVVQTLSTTSVAAAKKWDAMEITNTDHIQANSSGAGTGTLFSTHFAQYWDQSNFLNGGDSNTVTLSTGDQFTFSVKQANQNAPLWEVRWIVREGNTFYISQEVQTISGANQTYTSTTAYSDTSDGMWAVYDPFANSPSGVGTTGLNVDFEAGLATFSARNFTNITGIGFYTEIDTHSDSNKFLDIIGFGVSANVPELSTITYLGLMALLGVGWSYRQRVANRKSGSLENREEFV